MRLDSTASAIGARSALWPSRPRGICRSSDGSATKPPAAIARFTEEGERLLGVIERQLAQSRYLAGDAYSIADMAAYQWMVAAKTFLEEPLAHVLAGKPSMERWLQEIGARPAVQRGMQVPRV